MASRARARSCCKTPGSSSPASRRRPRRRHATFACIASSTAALGGVPTSRSCRRSACSRGPAWLAAAAATHSAAVAACAILEILRLDWAHPWHLVDRSVTRARAPSAREKRGQLVSRSTRPSEGRDRARPLVTRRHPLRCRRASRDQPPSDSLVDNRKLPASSIASFLQNDSSVSARRRQKKNRDAWPSLEANRSSTSELQHNSETFEFHVPLWRQLYELGSFCGVLATRR